MVLVFIYLSSSLFMNILPAQINEFKISATLIPNQQIIELLRLSFLHFYPEDEKNSSKYDSSISTVFSESFANAVDVFSRDLKNTGEQDCILIDVF